MSAFQTAFERQDQTKSIRAVTIFTAKILFALALVLTATVALVRTEVLVVDAQQLGNTDLLLIMP
jgi:hypothetical protein